jgi:hypothetical protein
MKTICLLAAVTLLVLACNNNDKVPSKVSCQGWVAREIEQDPTYGELSRKFTLHCNGKCPGGKPCEILSLSYDPPTFGRLIKEEWCGCKGDEKPKACDVVLRTYNSNGMIVQQADCTGWNTCPTDADSCIQKNKGGRVDTLRSVAGKDSIYRYLDTITCECVNRVGLK